MLAAAEEITVAAWMAEGAMMLKLMMVVDLR